MLQTWSFASENRLAGGSQAEAEACFTRKLVDQLPTAVTWKAHALRIFGVARQEAKPT